MFSKKKPSLGFKEKTRTHSEVNNDYSQHAFHVGHKGRTINNLQSQIDKIEAEINKHFEEMERLGLEASKIPAPEAVEPVAADTSEEKKA